MTNSAPGLGWPSEADAAGAGQDPDLPASAAAAARDVVAMAIDAHLLPAPSVLPDRYARRASRIGLGWPGGPAQQAPGESPPASDPPPEPDMPLSGLPATEVTPSAGSAPGPVDAPRGGAFPAGPALVAAAEAAEARESGRPQEPVGLGSWSAPTSGERAEPAPARVRQALAAVSRETPATGSAVLAGEEAADQESEDLVVIPVVPSGAADTPIARAAQAAVVARSGGETWPRPPACRVMTIANQKGGVGKTTTAVNLAASLAMHGARVLVIDLDPQGNASTALDVDHHSGTPSVYDVLVDGRPLSSVVKPVAGFPALYCAPAAIDLAGAEIELVPLVARESRLARALAAHDASNLDYILIDCPPSLGLLTVNALVAAPEVLIPIQCEYYALEGLEQLLRTVELVRSHLNPNLAVTTILLTMYDARTRLASQVADEVRDHFGGVVLGSVIPRSVRVSEAPSYGQSVMTYDPGSTGAQAYLEAARELARRNVQQPAG
jgi:chromosome partitioning protein